MCVRASVSRLSRTVHVNVQVGVAGVFVCWLLLLMFLLAVVHHNVSLAKGGRAAGISWAGLKLIYCDLKAIHETCVSA